MNRIFHYSYGHSQLGGIRKLRGSISGIFNPPLLIEIFCGFGPGQSYEVIEVSDFTGSTAGMNNYVKDNQPEKVIMVTECSMSDNVAIENPNVEFVRPCNLCPHMKRITLKKIYDALRFDQHEVIVDNQIIDKARLSIDRMLEIGRQQ